LQSKRFKKGEKSAAERPAMPLSLAMLLAESARKYPGRAAAALGEERVTYGRLWSEVFSLPRSCVTSTA
jgi:hypothetical protein